jgi:hypothetical protein
VFEAEEGKSLLDELREQFPEEAGFKIEEAVWVGVVDGEDVTAPLTIVEGNGLRLEFRGRQSLAGTATCSTYSPAMTRTTRR